MRKYYVRYDTYQVYDETSVRTFTSNENVPYMYYRKLFI